MEDYLHVVQYYETDKMGFVHHSNYVRWMEEARINFLNNLGYEYVELEKENILSIIVSISCRYKHFTTFGDIVSIKVEVEEIQNFRFKLKYTMKNQDGTLVFEGFSEQVFTNSNNKLLIIKKEFPMFYETLSNLIK